MGQWTPGDEFANRLEKSLTSAGREVRNVEGRWKCVVRFFGWADEPWEMRDVLMRSYHVR